MKRYKKETKDALEIGEVFYAKRFVLTVDKSLCKGCDLCRLVCPRDAITLKQVPDSPDGRAMAPTLDIDENKCDFHGICDVVCPFSAIQIMVDSQEDIPAVSRDVFPVLLRDIEIDINKCEQDCNICAEKCPLGAISIEADPHSVEIKKELCASCQICWVECPKDAVRVSKFYEGSIRIKRDTCPEGCHRCLDVCPVNALFMGDDTKVYANDMFCIYCGACLNVCPSLGSLEIQRTSIRHTPVESGAWNKALEKLTSTEGLERELAAKRAEKAREAVLNLKLSR